MIHQTKQVTYLHNRAVDSGHSGSRFTTRFLYRFKCQFASYMKSSMKLLP